MHNAFTRLISVSSLALSLCFAIASEVESGTVDPEAMELVDEILSQVPAETLSASGELNIRDQNGKRRKVQFTHAITAEPGGWKSVYQVQTEPGSHGGADRLEVIHRIGQPNEYLYWNNFRDPATREHPVQLKGDAAAFPFAGSDFWLSDLGLAFLDWPEQRLIRGNKITMQNGRPFKTLESVNPNPVGSNYARVVSRIDSEYSGLIQAEAFDSDRKLHKVFSLKSVKHGRVNKMEIRNEKQDTRTTIEFFYETDEEDR
ncbi:MAG: outer membrane lipoprotein-sorting protein [Verrucomicrobia bacterium]|nr:outer membrane lipoprotein-sorting protein [Verrucomicrobiota bacterium]